MWKNVENMFEQERRKTNIVGKSLQNHVSGMSRTEKECSIFISCISQAELRDTAPVLSAICQQAIELGESHGVLVLQHPAKVVILVPSFSIP